MEKKLKQELEKKIVELLKEGYNKKTVFEELKQTSKNPIELAKLIQKYPTEENKKKYKKQNQRDPTGIIIFCKYRNRIFKKQRKR